MTTWFTSDLHFGHKNIMNYCNRPWAKDPRNPTDAEARDMDEALIANWNAVVGERDEVFNLGDFALGCQFSHAWSCLERLNGRQIFIEGNHDGLAFRLRSHFYTYNTGYMETQVEGQKIVMCHYALREWHHSLRGVWHLYGHNHGTLPPFGKSVDVGVDNVHSFVPGAWYRPVSFEELKTFMERQPIGPHPAFEHFRASEGAAPGEVA